MLTIPAGHRQLRDSSRRARTDVNAARVGAKRCVRAVDAATVETSEPVVDHCVAARHRVRRDKPSHGQVPRVGEIRREHPRMRAGADTPGRTG